MRGKSVICVVSGHRWTQPQEFHESYPVFECVRCGRRQPFAPGSSQAGFGNRLEAQAGADRAVGPRGPSGGRR